MPPPDKSDVTISFPYTLTIEIQTTAPDVAQILLNGGTGPVHAVLAEANEYAWIADVTVVTHSGEPWDVPLELGGADGDRFALSNSATAPCTLTVGSVSLAGGSYAISISAPPGS